MSITLYGIPNCDTVKKARMWLADRGHIVAFHDVKKAGLSEAMVASWLTQVPWDILVNKKGTTWRGLTETQKTDVVDASSATTLMLAAPSVIKRPVLCDGKRVVVGFSDATYQQHFNPI